MLIFEVGRVRQQNGMKPSKTWVYTESSGLRMIAAKKQEMVLEAQTRELNVPRYLFLQRVKCGYEMAWNHPKHEF